MPITSVAQWSVTPALNTDIGGVDLTVTMRPSDVNDADQNMMAQAKAEFDAKLALAGGTMTGVMLLSTSTNVTTAPPLAYSGDPDTGIGHPGANRVSITTAGVKQVEVTAAGVLELTQGQIKFPATAVPSADANTLDDYDEASFTPVIAGGSTPGTCTYVARSGRVTKIGNVVMLTTEAEWNTHTGTGNLQMESLPYAASANSVFSLMFSAYDFPASSAPFAYIISGSNFVSFRSAVSGATIITKAVEAAALIYISGCYFT